MVATPATDLISRDRPRVLVVDDDPSFRNLLVAALRRDYIVSVASDGKDGFTRALEHKPDVAIVDVEMPGWNGIQTLTNFRNNPTLNRVPVIMLTANSNRDIVVAAIHAGAADYIIKTAFNREELISRLARYTNRNAVPRSDGKSAAEASPSDAGKPTVGPIDPTLQEVIDTWG